MSRYRVGKHWQRTIIREGQGEPDPATSRRSGDALIAVATDDPVQARLIVAALNAYGDVGRQAVHVLEGIPLRLAEERRVRELSMLQCAKQVGVSISTISRVEAGEDYVTSTAVAILVWLATPRPPLR